MPAQPEGVRGVGADGETGGRISPQAPYPSPLAKCAVCRQTPKVGAECGNPARSDLCGGTGVTRFPTAIRLILVQTELPQPRPDIHRRFLQAGDACGGLSC